MSTVNPAEISQRLKDEIAALNVTHGFEEAGRVERVGDGIARIEGLEKIMVGELVEFDDGTQGMALNLEDNFVGVVVMGSDAGIKEGDAVRLTGRTADVPVGDALLGRVVNSLGEPIDGKGTIYASGRRPVESDAPSVIVRKEVNEPLFTGTKAIDALVPIGKGQRELIIGDRETGKTAIAIDAILNQKGQDVNCVYVAIGQKASTVARIISRLTEEGAMDYTTIVLATAADPAPLQYIAPYAGTAIAEHWMHEGKDTLVVYDDLSKHAVAYREISLLLGRPPGREAYPGDVFYLHSRLLERSASMDEEHGGGSLTALPIVETQGGDISAYIPTNVISITDGQIYLEANLFNSGVRPAINPGLSVSRVGGSAQIDAMKKIAGPLRIEYAQYNELSAFAQFGSDLNPDTLARLEHGERIVEVLKQRQYDPKDIAEQVIILYALSEGHLQDVPVQQVAQFEDDLIAHINNFESDIKREIIETGQVSKVLEERIQDIIDDILNQYEYED